MSEVYENVICNSNLKNQPTAWGGGGGDWVCFAHSAWKEQAFPKMALGSPGFWKPHCLGCVEWGREERASPCSSQGFVATLASHKMGDLLLARAAGHGALGSQSSGFPSLSLDGDEKSLLCVNATNPEFLGSLFPFHPHSQTGEIPSECMSSL